MKKLILPLAIIVATIFSNCGPSKKINTTPGSTPGKVDVTFDANVLPIIQSSCTPCHISGQGKKSALNQYDNAKSEIDDIIRRISKQKGEHGFMPMRGERLADNLIQTFKDWKEQGLVQKN